MKKEEKSKWSCNNDPLDIGIGYVRKQREYGALDNKEYFHYFPELPTYFTHPLSKAPSELKKLINVADKIFNDSIKVSQLALKEIEKGKQGAFERFFPHGSTRPGSGILRFLKYHPTTRGRHIAQGHYDKSGLTLALAESKPGLRIGFDEKDMRLVEHKSGFALTFPGIKFTKLTDGVIRPSWHEAVELDEKPYRPDCSRWAIVFFLHPEGIETASFEDHHRPLTK
ncbi:2OG-Fe(II) oxygenase family protein [Candidatus Jorgensenbacteria bacterium]|nr:2OG-Fe(II) oxygenase family protein [Candidatus Jorgensenbacteria bacterium]